mmetsp:Transcript_15376/g.39355  ORF Transcript_15376/g.39355 Transcript_15376/m.39355 type:complete len:129 (+) Transcript_15376:620-1006(+)
MVRRWFRVEHVWVDDSRTETSSSCGRAHKRASMVSIAQMEIAMGSSRPCPRIYKLVEFLERININAIMAASASEKTDETSNDQHIGKGTTVPRAWPSSQVCGEIVSRRDPRSLISELVGKISEFYEAF